MSTPKSRNKEKQKYNEFFYYWVVYWKLGIFVFIFIFNLCLFVLTFSFLKINIDYYASPIHIYLLNSFVYASYKACITFLSLNISDFIYLLRDGPCNNFQAALITTPNHSIFNILAGPHQKFWISYCQVPKTA